MSTATLLGCVGLIPAMVLSCFLKAWAITTLWAWFIFPTWHLATPSYGAALGLSILIGALTHDRSGESKGGPASPAEALVLAYGTILGGPIVAVALGWCVKVWM